MSIVRNLSIACIALLGAAMAKPSDFGQGLLRSTRDTVLEQDDFSPGEQRYIHFVNRGKSVVLLDSLEVGVDRALFKTLSVSFLVDDGEGDWEKVFYWSESPRKMWLSRPLVIHPGDSLRFVMVRLDRCPKCEGGPASGRKSIPFSAPVTFRSRTGDAVGFVLKGWYLDAR